MIKRAVVTLNPADTGQIPVAQVQWSSSNTTNNVQVITPYGFYSVAPTGSLALMFNVMGQEENRAAIIDNPKGRFKNLKPTEVAVGNPLTESVIKFLENGDIEVTGKADQNINITGSVNLTVGGDVNVTTTGNTTVITTGNTTIDSTGNMSSTIGGTLTANVTGNTNITSPIVTVTGALKVTGDVTAFSGLGGEITFSDIVTKYNVHTHISATAGSPSSTSSNTLP